MCVTKGDVCEDDFFLLGALLIRKLGSKDVCLGETLEYSLKNQ